MNDPLVSFNTPFQSGDGLCYPIYPKNYYKTETTPMFGGRKSKKSSKSNKQKGGTTIGDYSQPSTVNDYPGNAYLTNPDQRYALTGSGIPQQMNPLTEKFLNSNMGITYATQAGGRNKNKKGVLDLDSPNSFDDFNSMFARSDGKMEDNLHRANSQRGGKNNINLNLFRQNITAEEEMSHKLSILSPTTTQGIYPVLSGGKKKYNKKGGNVPPNMQHPTIPQPTMQQLNIPPGTQLAIPPGTQLAIPPTMQQPNMQNIMSGGRYKKYSKKCCNNIFTPGATFSSQTAEIASQMNPLAQAQHIPRGGFAMKNMSGVDAQMAASGSYIPSEMNEMMGGRKKSSRKLKGGVSDFATTLSSRGPINYPDQPSADRFRYFNKTGTFIPNTQLQYAAAPISTGYEADSNPYPMAYNDYIGGAKKKKAPKKKTSTDKKKKTTVTKKKTTTTSTKKSASTKKKTASTKKK